MRQPKTPRNHMTRMIVALALVFLLFTAGFLVAGSGYISNNLLQANEAAAIDIALLVKNNFSITDEEVAYMKGLSFNEMEVDPINQRLMDIGEGVELNAAVENVYLIVPLHESEQRLCKTERESELVGYHVGTVLDGMWLLNGAIDEDGHFRPTQREDICRYTVLTEKQRAGIHDSKPYSEFSSDIWGDFITGYVPIYTVEGNFAGLLGIDVTPDRYQQAAQQMMWFLIGTFALITVCLCIMFVIFYMKYIRAKKDSIYFDFYSRMSHDMRTPMSGILGMAAVSRDETDVNVLHRNFESVEAAGKYMLRLINDTLDIQKINTGKLTFSPGYYDGGKLVNELVELIAPAAGQEGVEFRLHNEGVQLDCLCYVDEVRLKQVFMNLVSNAIKFTPAGGCVTFGMECLDGEGNINHLKFTVSDTGVGMSENYIKTRMFKPFEQESNSLTAKYDGSGLGLYITKQLVELMGGRITVDSKPGVGTTFTVYLDIKTKERGETAPAAPQTGDPFPRDAELAGRHILVCEDHHLNAEIVKRILEKAGCIIDVAENGEAGLEAFRKSEARYYDAILMDIRMPVMDGLTAAGKIRRLDRAEAKTVPIIAMTANAYEEDVRRSLEAGMNEHLAKPVDPAKLLETLRRTIREKTEDSVLRP